MLARYKKLSAEAGALTVHGHIERQERAVNVVTERMEPLPLRGRVRTLPVRYLRGMLSPPVTRETPLDH